MSDTENAVEVQPLTFYRGEPGSVNKDFRPRQSDPVEAAHTAPEAPTDAPADDDTRDTDAADSGPEGGPEGEADAGVPVVHPSAIPAPPATPKD